MQRPSPDTERPYASSWRQRGETVAAIFVVAVLGNYPWELAQAPLYAGMESFRRDGAHRRWPPPEAVQQNSSSTCVCLRGPADCPTAGDTRQGQHTTSLLLYHISIAPARVLHGCVDCARSVSPLRFMVS
jgi:hypothetical protein